MEILVQAAVAVVIVLIGFVSFKKFPFRIDTKSMMTVALFVVIANVLSLYVSLRLPLFGVDSLRIGFAQIVLAIGGCLLTPGYAFMMGIVYDLLGLILSPTTPFLGFTLNAILACWMPSVWYHRGHKKDMSKTVYLILGGLMIVFMAYFIITPSIKISDETVMMELNLKIACCLMTVLIFVALILILYMIQKKNRLSATELSNWMLMCVMIEVLIQFICTPLWLQLLWNVPWSASLFVRVLKSIVMIPLNTLIGSMALRALRQVK